LPHEQVYSVNVGDQLFRLSGASLSYDAPSYFTKYFQTADSSAPLYIDRSPQVFTSIVRHLQGYHVAPKDEVDFVYLYADAHYYQLPKLIRQLYNSEIFVRIGAAPFRIPRELLTHPGDTPNFFTVSFSAFFGSPQDIFPGTKGLMRPPAVSPPYVPMHSDELFAELLQALKGAPVDIRSDDHRERLLRECRYYRLRGLEQKLLSHRIEFNAGTAREEITLRLQDLKPKGVSLQDAAGPRAVLYARPFVDAAPRDLLVQ
ncbi:uncharacterized protein V1510DRAFT_351586, partial [Dipodascopsis tothii]|uniref:uncharacterized protein n=1 Tax=Dipodascopsis tothii TaxID=44089 RepID=UPI0034CD7932